MINYKDKNYPVKHIILLIIVCITLMLWNGSIDISEYPNIDEHSYRSMPH